MKKGLLGVGLTAAALLVSGCSTILKGNYEKLTIVSTPERAHCSVYRESEGYLKAIVTPGARYIPRSAEPIRIVCKKAGHETVTITAKPVKAGEVAANVAGLAAGSGVGLPLMVGGLFFDTLTGNNNELPDVISVVLPELQ